MRLRKIALNNIIKYRDDIDGLRAIAVLSVILFHINPTWISGGFLGVDIFFVISGYLITLILAKEVKQTHKIDIVNFYKRRIKRIVPALLFVMIPTFIVGFLLFTPDNLLGLAKSINWSFFSAANIYFYSSIDTSYFATGSQELPLLHLWSLGVEEQFYILWPFIVLFILKYVHRIKNQLLIVTLLFVSSLVWAQIIIDANHSFAYYMLFTRAWELLAGAGIALLFHSGFRIKGLYNELMAFVGLIAITLSFIYISKSDSVPGVAALPSIIGTALLILSGIHQKTYIGQVLSLKLLVAVGLVSYSAYLWHWPILAFLRYSLIEIDLTISIFVLFATFILATISYFFIETPFRKNDISTQKTFLYYFVIPAIIIFSISMVTITAIKNKSDFIFPWKKMEHIDSNTLQASAYKDNCQCTLFNIDIYTQKQCVYPMNIDKANVFLIGDSNAGHYLGMLKVFAKEYGFSIRNASQNACPMVFNNNFDWISGIYKKGCSSYIESIAKEAKKYDTVFIGGAWDYYYAKKDFAEPFEQTIAELSKNVKHVILLGQVPYFGSYSKECEQRSIRIKSLNCSKRFDYKYKGIQSKSNKFVQSIANKYDNVEYFNIINQLCSNGKCSPYLNGVPVYFNTNHLSMKGSELIGKNMLHTDDPMLNIFDKLKNQKQTYLTKDKISDTVIVIEEKNKSVVFQVKPKIKNIKMAFYLYKDDKRIDIQWYSQKFFYVLNKDKYSVGNYRIRYFVVDKDVNNPGKQKKIEQGFSEYMEIK